MGIISAFNRVFKFPKINIDKYDQNRVEAETQQVSIPEVNNIVIPSFPSESVQKYRIWSTNLETISRGSGALWTGELDVLALTTEKICIRWLNMFLRVIPVNVSFQVLIRFRIARKVGTGDVDVMEFPLAVHYEPTSVTRTEETLNIFLHDLVIPAQYRLYVDWRIDAQGIGSETFMTKVVVSGYTF